MPPSPRLGLLRNNSESNLEGITSDSADESATAEVVLTPKTQKSVRMSLSVQNTPIRDYLTSWAPPKHDRIPASPSPNTPGGAANPETNTSVSEFIDFICLSGSPEKVGYSLLERLEPLIDTTIHTYAHTLEVEILIHAHYCFLIASDMVCIALPPTSSPVKGRCRPRVGSHQEKSLCLREKQGIQAPRTSDHRNKRVHSTEIPDDPTHTT